MDQFFQLPFWFVVLSSTLYDVKISGKRKKNPPSYCIEINPLLATQVGPSMYDKENNKEKLFSCPSGEHKTEVFVAYKMLMKKLNFVIFVVD